MKIGFVGDYLPDYNRTSIIRNGLLKLGHTVIDFPFKKKDRKTRARLKELDSSVDFFFLPSFTHQQASFVRKNVRKKIIFDPLISRYLTKVHDYKLVSPYSLSALRNHFRDKWALEAADFVVTDTEAHRQYFHRRYKYPLEKMAVLYIGNDFDQFFPAEPKRSTADKFIVGFYGGFIPLQGVLKILEAAVLLRDRTDIVFRLIGSGFQFEEAKRFVNQNRLKNVELPGWLTPPELLTQIQQFDVALGIFGETQKSDLVIPNKIYHYAACGKAIITKRSPAISELFQDKTHLINTGTRPEEIAEAILYLQTDAGLRQNLGQAAYEKLRNQYSSEHVAKALIGFFEKSVR